MNQSSLSLRIPRWSAAFGLAFVVFFGLSVELGAQESNPEIRWLALGDSFTSGEGLPTESITDDRCQRGDAENAPGAWPVEANRQLDPRSVLVGDFVFVACTGAMTDHVADRAQDGVELTQLGEAEAASPGRFDLVTFTLGGNNLGFADVLEACESVTWFLSEIRNVGNSDCNTELDGVPAAIDYLLSDGEGAKPASYRGDATLVDVIDSVIDQSLEPGGTIMVVGYPRLFEASEKWSFWTRWTLRCGLHLSVHTDTLREYADRLGAETEAWVEQIDTRYPDASIEYVDVRSVFEPSDGSGDRHELCGRGGDWLTDARSIFAVRQTMSGSEVDLRPQRAYHPNEFGHAAIASAVASRIEQTDWVR